MTAPSSDENDLLSTTLAAAAQDQKTTDEDHDLLVPLPDGASFRETHCLVDERGSLTEIFDPRWGWHPDPLVYCYKVTIRPGVVKGWALHKTHQDRYFVIDGDMEVVLYDVRPGSPTEGRLSKVYLSGGRPRIFNIPAFVWHADRNVGSTDVTLLNLPTRPYDHDNPDKFRLPLDTDLIPHDFGDAKGW